MTTIIGHPELGNLFMVFFIFISVNVTFFPIHFLGISGIPRRYADYPVAMYTWDKICSDGATCSFGSIFFFIFILWEGFSRSRIVFTVVRGPSSFFSFLSYLFSLLSSLFSLLSSLFSLLSDPL